MLNKKTIIISAINLREGGPLSILDDCLQYLDRELSKNFQIITLVHKKELLTKTENISFIEFPKSIKSYFYRFYYEYFYFKKISKKLKPYLWLSLHDITPNVTSEIQSVYCHNASPFYKVSIKDLFVDYKFVIFNIFYKYVYKINIKKNNFLIVQQKWLKKEFERLYNIKNVIVANPTIEISIPNKLNGGKKRDKLVFFFPSFPRVFKNFELICEAVRLIKNSYRDKYEVILTINGSENRYSQKILKKYSSINNIKFIGLQPRSKVFEIYLFADCLIFPSKLETWGLPITEFKAFNKPILVADLPYARETVGDYDKVKFFNPNDPRELASYMECLIEGRIKFDVNKSANSVELKADSWKELFDILLLEKS